MKERPIPFSAPMVRALLAGAKSQTRRVVKPQPDTHPGMNCTRLTFKDRRGNPLLDEALEAPEPVLYRSLCPYGQPGDRLWVREAWRVAAVHDHVPGSELGFAPLPQVQYEAIGDGRDETGVQWGRYRHARFMPRWASRITLEITGVRVERLQDISEADARAEGASFHDGRGIGHSGWRHDYGDVHENARSAYARLWNDINGHGSWDANPWVWVIEFRRCER